MNYIIMLYLTREATWWYITTNGILVKKKTLSFQDRIFLFAYSTHSNQNEKEVCYFYP